MTVPLYFTSCPHLERTNEGYCIPCTAAVAVAESLVHAFVALRRRYACGLPVDCGGTCSRLEHHDGACACMPDEEGNETCPA